MGKRIKQYTGASKTDAVTERELRNKEIAYRAAAEGIVLLKNENDTLPMRPGKVALYGAGAEKTVKGGVGSGEVNERHNVSILEGMEAAGFEVTTKAWIQDYKAQYDSVFTNADKLKLRDMFDINIMDNLPLLPYGRKITDEDIEKNGCDTAIYVVARQAGEGADKKIEKGEFDLSDIEIFNIKKIAANYKKTILVINSGSYMNLSSLDEVGISALIFYCQQGMEGGRAFADIISGKVNPSGKLTDTWAKTYDDIPFGNEYSYLSGDTTQEYYREGIYVGYRYFDTYQVEPRYHFGFGLSYTTFDIKCAGAELEKEKVIMRINVRNTGRYAGKEVIQIYVSAPDGHLKKEYQRLVGFAKTRELQPGEEQILTVTFNMGYCASYCEESASYVLEEGDYIIRVGNASDKTQPYAVVKTDEKAIVSKNKNICVPDKEISEITPIVRLNESNLEDAIVLILKTEDIRTDNVKYETPTVYSDEQVDAVMKKFTVKDMIEVCGGSGVMGLLSTKKNFTPGAVGRTTDKLYRKGLINVNLSDGPTGLRIMRVSALSRWGNLKFVAGNNLISIMDIMPDWLMKPLRANEKKDRLLYQYATAFPVGTALAQGWNEELCEEIGRAVSDEMDDYNITFWLGPAMNIHKNPLCGRNYEYMSEDPVLTGKIAAAIVRGVQSISGNYVTIKHFACNNAEDNRNHSNSNVNERALREIYLKGFEIAVREGKAKAVMTSYNLINGIYTANRYDLCTSLLRNEWGFDGVVMTDWWATGKDCGRNDLAIMAGNDLIMPGGGAGKKEILKSLKAGTLTEEKVRRSCANIVRSIVHSNVTKKVKPEMFV